MVCFKLEVVNSNVMNSACALCYCNLIVGEVTSSLLFKLSYSEFVIDLAKLNIQTKVVFWPKLHDQISRIVVLRSVPDMQLSKNLPVCKTLSQLPSCDHYRDV